MIAESTHATPPEVLRGPVALVLNDVINSNLATPDDPERMTKITASGLVRNLVRLVALARAVDVPIFWIQVERRADRADTVSALVDRFHRGATGPRPPVLAGSVQGRNIDELPVVDGDQVVFKPRMDPFIGTELDLMLRSRGVRTILWGGYATNGGVESGIRTANDLNYDNVSVLDCCYNVEEDAHEFALTRVLPYYSRIRTTEQVAELLALGAAG